MLVCNILYTMYILHIIQYVDTSTHIIHVQIEPGWTWWLCKSESFWCGFGSWSVHVISSVHDLTRSFRFRYIQCSGANVHWTATAFWIFFTAIGWPVPKKSVVLRATATSATCCKCFKQFDMWQDATLKWRLQTASKTQCQQEITTGCGLNMLQWWCWTMLNE